MLATKNEGEGGRWKLENGIFRQRAGFHLSAFAARHSAASARRRPSSIFHLRFLLFLALALFIAGCTPSGSRALLKGKKLLERGDYAGAVAQFKTATSLLATNAQAWNYLGVAYQYAGQPTNAATAYQCALARDRDLMEAHYNLGCLWLEQNKPDAAEGEFTAYTLRRPKAPEGWLKLGLAQLQSHDVTSAEKSFSTALYLNPNNAEALNGLGLARVERGRPREAAQFFTVAAKEQPDYAPAWLNLATVAQQYLHDNTLALQNYRTYLALTPRPANWDAVNDIANSLEPPAAVAAANPPPANQNQTAAFTAENKTPAAGSAVRTTGLPRTQAVVRASSNPPRGNNSGADREGPAANGDCRDARGRNAAGTGDREDGCLEQAESAELVSFFRAGKKRRNGSDAPAATDGEQQPCRRNAAVAGKFQHPNANCIRACARAGCGAETGQDCSARAAAVSALLVSFATQTAGGRPADGIGCVHPGAGV